MSAAVCSDRELVKRCLAGSEPAFRELYHRHVDRVYRIAARILGPAADVGDVVQQVFIAVDRSLPRYRGEAAFTTWLHRITVNVTTGALRARLRDRGRETTFAVDAVVDLGGKLEAREALCRLYAALEPLPAKGRVAFVLVELEGMSLEEMAAATGVPLFTAAARLRRARAALAGALDEPRLVARRAGGRRDE